MLAALAAPAEERLQMIVFINSQPGVLWKAAMTPRFEHEPVGAASRLCGVMADNREKMEMLRAAGLLATAPKPSAEDVASLPKEFNVAGKWPECKKVVDDIRDQSNCGCCWAFAPAGAASDRLCIATKAKALVPLSAQQACFCPFEFSGDCDGGYPTSAWLHVMREGLVTGGQYNHTGPFGDLGLCSAYSLPHCHHHGPRGEDPYPAEGHKGCKPFDSPQCPRACDGSARQPFDSMKNVYKASGGQDVVHELDGEKAMMHALATHGSLSVSMDVYEDFENYQSGVYHNVKGKNLGGHAVRLVGWGEEEAHETVEGAESSSTSKRNSTAVKYWKIANSWNRYWGEDGYFRIRRGVNECGIEDWPLATQAEVKWSGPGL